MTRPLRLLVALLLAMPAAAQAAPPPILPYQGGLPPILPYQGGLPPISPGLSGAPIPAAPFPVAPSRPTDPNAEPPRYAGMVEAHNRARRAVGVPPLQWSAQLAATAQTWADRLRGEHCGMRHSRATGLGENLAWAAQQKMSPAAVVALWVDEARAYNRAANSCAAGAICGHYTQVVWRNTNAVGCGRADCGDAEVWVCNYTPPGNYNRERPY